jgi:hypothetical protein
MGRWRYFLANPSMSGVVFNDNPTGLVPLQ